MNDVAIIATAKAVPKQVVTNDELSQFLETSDEWISKRTGIKKRHLSQGENTSDLATSVARQLLEKQGLKAEQVDLIIVATMSPDSLTPSTAAIVQGKIHAQKALAFDLSAACSGFAYAFAIARSLMQSNHWQYGLVIGAEVLSKIIDWRDRSTAVLFGDGAGGVLLAGSHFKHVLATQLNTYGQLGNKLTAGRVKPEANFLENKHQFSAFQMAGRDVYRFATHKVPLSIEKATVHAGLKLSQIDYFLLHQANSRIIKQIAKDLKQPIEKFPLDIADYGNTAAASEAILLAECIDKSLIRKGNIVALSGFGGGLTTATIIFKY